MQFNFALVLLFTLLAFVVYTYSVVYKKNVRGVFISTSLLMNGIITTCFLLISTSFLINFIFYIKTLNLVNFITLSEPVGFISGLTIFKLSVFTFNINLYGYIIILLGIFIGFFSVLVSENKIKYLNINFFLYFNYFLLIIFVFTSINDILGLFICYELLLLPSFFFLYYISYTRKALQASLYFVVWTQLGSLLVLIGVLYMLKLVGDPSFAAVRLFVFTWKEAVTIYTLFFFGFGFKFPIWPFHYWLTKTHVEASSGFSIYLSGFLVKTALFGFFTLTNLICSEFDTAFFSVIAFLGAIDASLKMWGQSDLKKLVAYCTIQEMNLILISFLTGDSRVTMCGIMFSAAHAFLSSLMFFLVDCLYRRFHARSVYQLQGVLHKTPNLGIALFIMCVFYAGLPGTIKFSCEFFIFSTMSESSFITMFLLLFIMNVLGLIGFSKPWFNVLFGLPNKSMAKPVLDLSKKEIYIITYSLLFFIFFTYIALPLL